MTNLKLILASASPRRRELLESMGVAFEIHATAIDESRKDGEISEDFVIRLAREKANAAYRELADPNVAVLAADTIVVQGDNVYGKPSDFEHAQQIWQSLSSAKHRVLTAVTLLVRDKLSVRLGVTEVEFGRISIEQMQAYWASGEPQDKAGGYAIQGLASAWVKLLHGSYSNVVGLPLRDVNELLSTIDQNWL